MVTVNYVCWDAMYRVAGFNWYFLTSPKCSI